MSNMNLPATSKCAHLSSFFQNKSKLHTFQTGLYLNLGIMQWKISLQIIVSVIPNNPWNWYLRLKYFCQFLSKEQRAGYHLQQQMKTHLITKSWLSISFPHPLSRSMPEFPTTAHVLNRRFFIGETSGRSLCKSWEMFRVRRLSST